MSRLADLNNRYEIVVSQSNKSEKYFKVLWMVKNEIYKQEAINRKRNETNPLLIALRNTKGLSGFQILMLKNL